ncbi:MAG: ABC transporter substrate-binding protein [Chloroflexi bacterium]|nr:ABC transporter substrate-binding protein [Chloroflexota bacterium]
MTNPRKGVPVASGKKSGIAAGCLILALLVTACAPATQPTPTAKPVAPPAPAATKAAAPTPASPSTPKPAAPSPTSKPAADSAGGARGGTLTIGVGGDPPSFDIHQEQTAYVFAITAGTYSGLVRYDSQAWPQSKVIGDLAASWSVGTDGKVYTYSLVKGAKFHDGAPVTAEDVKFSLDRIRDPQLGLVRSPRRLQLAAISGIETPDDSTVKINLKYPQASFNPAIATVFYAMMPKRVVQANNNDMRKTILGSGPFKLKSYSSGVGWELARNSDYFVKDRPYLDSVKAYIIPDTFTRFAALRTRSVLWFAPFPYMTVSHAKIIEESLSDKIAVKWAFHPAWYAAVFNVNQAPWSDVRVRQAVSLAFDRKKMLAAGLEGAGVVGMSPMPPGEWALPEEEMMKMPGYARPDIEAARRLLAEAGYPAGFKADLIVRQVKPHQDFAVVLKDALASLGIELTLNVMETATFESTRFRKAFGILATGAGTPVMDPDTQLGDNYLSGATNNWSGYNDPAFDELFTKQSGTLDAGERRKIVWEMQRVLLRDTPMALAYWTNVAYAWWKEVRGFTPPTSLYDAYGGYHEMRIAK